MTSAIKNIKIHCEKCDNFYEDWYRPSVNLDLDDFDEKYLDEASSTVCPKCNLKVYLDSLTVSDGIFYLSNSDKAKNE